MKNAFARTATLFALVVLVLASLTGCTPQYTYQQPVAVAPQVHPDTGLNYFSGKRNVPSGWAGNAWTRHLQSGDLQGDGQPGTPHSGDFRHFDPRRPATREWVVNYVDRVSTSQVQTQQAVPQPVVYDWSWLLPWILGALLLGGLIWLLVWLLTRPRGDRQTTTTTSVVRNEPDTYRTGDRIVRHDHYHRYENENRGNGSQQPYQQQVLPPYGGYGQQQYGGPMPVRDDAANRKLRKIKQEIRENNRLLREILDLRKQAPGTVAQIREGQTVHQITRPDAEQARAIQEILSRLSALERRADQNDVRVEAIEQELMGVVDGLRLVIAGLDEANGRITSLVTAIGNGNDRLRRVMGGGASAPQQAPSRTHRP